MLWEEALQQYRQVVQQRWVMVEESEGSIPAPFVGMVVVWLMLIFAGYGLQAPRNRVVVTAFLLSALAISASIYLILDFDSPFSGLIQVTNDPLQRALGEVERPMTTWVEDTATRPAPEHPPIVSHTRQIIVAEFTTNL